MPILFFPIIPKHKKNLKEPRFASMEDIKNATLSEQKAIPKNEFQTCFGNWKRHWYKSIISNKDYFERGNIVVDE